MGKARYLTNEEIELITWRLHNNIYTVDDIFEDEISVSNGKKHQRVVKRFREEVAKEYLLEGEQYIQVPEKDYYIITSKGRVINTHLNRQISPRFLSYTHVFGLDRIQLSIKDVFHRQGWEYDINKIREEYDVRGWKYSKAKYY